MSIDVFILAVMLLLLFGMVGLYVKCKKELAAFEKFQLEMADKNATRIANEE